MPATDRGPRWRHVCSACGRVWPLEGRRWRCACGGLLDLVGPLADPVPGGGPPAAGSPPPTGSPLARYRGALPPGAGTVDLGMEVTPVAELTPGCWVKADYLHPTGSYKDRGASVMIGTAARLGVTEVLVDSSGNAGQAAAAHAARAGMTATVYLPAGTAPAKVAAIAAFGPAVVEVPGGRSAAAAAAMAAAGPGGPGRPWYASHVWQPAFHHGVKTLAFELYEQVPDLARATVAVPAGNGTIVLGLWLGFGELVAAGRLARRPALVAVQAELCAPLAGAAAPSSSEVASSEVAAPVNGPGGTVAAGIAIAHPPRAAQVRAAVLATGGSVVTVGEAAILAAQHELAGYGHPVEPTGAVAWAARPALAERSAESGGPVVAVLTGR